MSVDLIYGLPGQSAGRLARASCEIAAALAPQHLSCYQLTVEPGTPFAVMRRRGRLRELPEDAQGELVLLTHAWLAGHGYQPYEVCSFAAAPEHRSRHNPKYWRHAPYLGLGPSAHSFDGRRRWWNLRHLAPWSAAVAQGRRPVEDEEILTPAAARPRGAACWGCAPSTASISTAFGAGTVSTSSPPTAPPARRFVATACWPTTAAGCAPPPPAWRWPTGWRARFELAAEPAAGRPVESAPR